MTRTLYRISTFWQITKTITTQTCGPLGKGKKECSHADLSEKEKKKKIVMRTTQKREVEECSHADHSEKEKKKNLVMRTTRKSEKRMLSGGPLKMRKRRKILSCGPLRKGHSEKGKIRM